MYGRTMVEDYRTVHGYATHLDQALTILMPDLNLVLN